MIVSKRQSVKILKSFMSFSLHLGCILLETYCNKTTQMHSKRERIMMSKNGDQRCLSVPSGIMGKRDVTSQG